MRVNKYVFKIKRTKATGYDITEVYPHFKNLKKKWSFESGQKFFREKLEGQITFFDENFDLIYNASYETKFTFIIECEVSPGVMETYYVGTFSKTDCKFDVSSKKCEPTISPYDDYTDIMNNYENTYDLLKLPPAITPVYLYKRPCIQVYLTGSSTITNFVGGTYWEQDTNFDVDSVLDLRDKYYFTSYGSVTEFVLKTGTEVDGTYTKVCLQDQIEKITNENGYYLLYKAEGSYGYYYLYNPSGTALYKSEAVIEIVDGGYRFLFDNTSTYFIGNEFAFNALPPLASKTIRPSFVMARHIYQRLLCDVNSITDDEGQKTTHDVPADDIVANNNNYNKVIGLKSSNAILSTSKTVSEPTRYGINDTGGYFTSAFISSSTGLDRPLPLCRSAWNNVSIWYVYSQGYSAIDEKARKKYKLKDAYKLSDVIKAFLSKIAPGISHEATTEYSQFLYSSANPITSDAFTLFMTQKSNVIKGEYDQAAQKTEISFKDIMDMLAQCFRCYWHIEDGKFKIEHVSWYNNGRSYTGTPSVQYDLEVMTDPRNLKHLGYKQTSVEFDKSELSSRYEFGWMDDVTDAFSGTSIDVKSEYIDKSLTEDVTVQNFTTDVDYMLISPDSVSMDGFALMAAKKVGSTYELPFVKFEMQSAESHAFYTLNLQNGYLSWFYLVRFYMHDMSAANIEYEELLSLAVKQVKACVSHNLRFSILNTTPDLYSLINMDLGKGYIYEISVDLISKQADIVIYSRPT